MDSRRADETRIDVLHLRSEIAAVKESRDEAIRHITALNEQCIQAQRYAYIYIFKLLVFEIYVCVSI